MHNDLLIKLLNISYALSYSGPDRVTVSNITASVFCGVIVYPQTKMAKYVTKENHAAEAKSNPKAIWKYINSKTKTRVGVSELNTDPADPTSKLTTSDKEKAEVLGQFFSSVFTTEPDGDIPQIPTSNLSNEMEVLVIREENVK